MAFPLAGQTTGEEVFQTTCVACHTLTTDRLVGPGLAGVTTNRDREWLISFIVEPDRVIASGDSIATRLLAEYMVPMPNVGTTRAQAEAVLDFIAGVGAEVTPAEAAAAEGATVEAGPDATVRSASEDEIRFGRELFQGPARFANGGPTCNACHDVMQHDMMGGGTLAANLTDVLTRIGEPGVRAILQNPPFPVMQQAYEGMALSESEIDGLLAYLSQAEGQMPMNRAGRFGFMLLVTGIGGTLVLFGLFSLVWKGRRKGSVHQEIFDRQAGSS
jgi:mono/diheme cytochrome c family protein